MDGGGEEFAEGAVRVDVAFVEAVGGVVIAEKSCDGVEGGESWGGVGVGGGRVECEEVCEL